MTSRRAIRFACLVAFAAALLPAQGDPGREEWLQLFNGRDLDGWRPKIRGYDLGVNYGDTFRVDNGVLKVAYDQYADFGQRYGHIFYRDKFSHYILGVEYRFAGEQARGGPEWAFKNSGVMVHCLDPETMLRDQDFPISIEVQFLGGKGSGERPTANLCTPGTHVVMDGKLVTTHCLSSKSKTFHGEEWVRVDVKVLGGERIEHYVNGELVLAYDQPQIGGEVVSNYDPKVKRDGTPLTEGWISLQSESHPIEFRKVELLNLKGCMDPKAANYKSYYVEADPAACR